MPAQNANAIKKELGDRREGIGHIDEQIVGCIGEVRQDVRRLERAQQALFALVDSLAKVFLKVFLTCVPEPRGAAMETALAEARNRHDRLLNNAGHAMLSDSIVAMEDLMSRGEKQGQRARVPASTTEAASTRRTPAFRVSVQDHHASRSHEWYAEAPLLNAPRSSA